MADLELFEEQGDFDAGFQPRQIRTLEDLKWYISDENDMDCENRVCFSCPYWKTCGMKGDAHDMIWDLILDAQRREDDHR